MTSITCSVRSPSTSPLSTGAATAATCRRPWVRSRSAAAWWIPARIPRNGTAVVRIWQANIGKTIIAHVPITDGAVQETGDFELDGVTFPAAEVQLEFLDPAADEEGAGGSMFPTGNLVDDLEVPGVGTLNVTMINAGIPTIFVNARDIGYTRCRAAKRHQQRPESPGHVRNHPRPRCAAHGADRHPRRRRQAPAHAQGRLRCAACGVCVVQWQAGGCARMWTCWSGPCRWASCTTR